MSESIGVDFPKQQERCRKIQEQYRAIGPDGMFGANMIERVLQRAEQALAKDNIFNIISAYREMKDIKE